jgi:hypothetical protein
MRCRDEKAIGDPSALRFSAGFYRGLAFGKSYEDAFRLGCNEIDLASLPDSSIPRFTTWQGDRVPQRGHELEKSATSLFPPTRTWVKDDRESADPDHPDSPRLYPVWFGTDRQPNDVNDIGKGFSAKRASDASAVYFGICQVAIPKSHKFGSVGSAWWRRFLRIDDDRVSVKRIGPLERNVFWLSARKALAESRVSDRIGLVFIHGFRVTFEEAAIRAAQIGFDLKVAWDNSVL